MLIISLCAIRTMDRERSSMSENLTRQSFVPEYISRDAADSAKLCIVDSRRNVKGDRIGGDQASKGIAFKLYETRASGASCFKELRAAPIVPACSRVVAILFITCKTRINKAHVTIPSRSRARKCNQRSSALSILFAAIFQ